MTSIPRDYYVVLPSKGENAYDKLTHAGYYGVGESVKAIEKLGSQSGKPKKEVLIADCGELK